MAVGTQYLRLFRCDMRDCSQSGRYEHDGQAGKAGWAIVTINSREYALCHTHKIEIENQLSQMGAVQ